MPSDTPTPAEIVEGPSDSEVDESLRMGGFDLDERYPEHGHDALRAAYQFGWDDARAALAEHYHLLPRVQVCPDVETDYFSTEGNGMVEVPDLDPGYVYAEIDDHLPPHGARCVASALASAADVAEVKP